MWGKLWFLKKNHTDFNKTPQSTICEVSWDFEEIVGEPTTTINSSNWGWLSNIFFLKSARYRLQCNSLLDTVLVQDTVLASYPCLRKKVTVIENKRYIYIYTVYFCFFSQVKSQIVYFFLFLLLTFPYYLKCTKFGEYKIWRIWRILIKFAKLNTRQI